MNNSITITLVIAFKTLFLAGIAWAEEQPQPGPPGSEVLLFSYAIDVDGAYVFSQAKNISQSQGYDSQPRFSHDGKTIYYTHFTGQQMDIWQHDVQSGQSQPFIKTAESEYSPTPVPGQTAVGVVQVDAEGNQYLVLLNKDKNTHSAKRYMDLKQVGYFNWTNDGHLWSFILNDSGGDLYHTDQDIKSTKISNHIGRSFITNPQRDRLYFVDKNTQPWRIKSIDHQTKKPVDVMPLPLGVEDFTMDEAGRLWCGRGNTLFVSEQHKKWSIAHEFQDPNFGEISRITTHKNHMAIVFAEQSNK